MVLQKSQDHSYFWYLKNTDQSVTVAFATENQRPTKDGRLENPAFLGKQLRLYGLIPESLLTLYKWDLAHGAPALQCSHIV